MAVITQLKNPSTLAALKWAATIRAGIDPEEFIPDALREAEGAAISASMWAGGTDLFGMMKPVASVEEAILMQVRKNKKRIRLGNLTAFQTVPQYIDYTLRLRRVVLRNLPEVEGFLNFLPNNLLFQQLPFIVQLQGMGNSRDSNSKVIHFCLGCWFGESSVKWDVVSRDDSKLIQDCSVDVTSVLTFDASIQGDPKVQFASSLAAFIGRALPSSVEDTITDLNLA